jgi:hypothetical protein
VPNGLAKQQWCFSDNITFCYIPFCIERKTHNAIFGTCYIAQTRVTIKEVHLAGHSENENNWELPSV